MIVTAPEKASGNLIIY